MTVIIYFVGLIAHLQYGMNPARNVAALVYEMNHKPLLVLPKDAVKSATFTKVDEQDQNGVTYWYYDLSGSGRITIENIAAGPVTWLTHFTNEVKSLKDATKKTDLKADVKAEISSAAYAYIELHGGDLDVAGYYQYDYEYDGNDTPCVPSRTSFTTTTASGNMIRFVADNGNQMVVDVSANPSITIANVPTKPMVGHFKHYADLMDGGNESIVKKWADPGQPQKCLLTPIFTPSDVDVGKADTADCTNTHFP
jgi:hypothetical protein